MTLRLLVFIVRPTIVLWLAAILLVRCYFVLLFFCAILLFCCWLQVGGIYATVSACIARLDFLSRFMNILLMVRNVAWELP